MVGETSSKKRCLDIFSDDESDDDSVQGENEHQENRNSRSGGNGEETSAPTTRDACCSHTVDLSRAQNRWPVLRLSIIESGVLDVQPRKPGDILAMEAIAYTRQYMLEHSFLLLNLVNGLQIESLKFKAIKSARKLLGAKSACVCYLLITILLTFDTTGLVATTKEVVRRVNKQLPTLTIIEPVCDELIVEARRVLAGTGAENCSGTLDESCFNPYFGQFVQDLDETTHNELRLTSDMAYNVSLNKAI